MLGAFASRTRGALLLAGGEAQAALGPLRAALEAWQQLDTPYEAAQVRLLLVVACRQLKDHDRAQLECDVAREAFEQLGAAPALAQLDRLLADAPGGAESSSESSVSRAVTDRELQVLRLVAGGQTNRGIAAELAISERTVERHITNIFTKLGVSNRTAAAAHAFDHGLL